MTPPELKLRLTSPFPSSAVDRLITELSVLDEITDPTRVVIDLASLGRISVASAAVLVCALREIEARGLLAEGSEILAPTQPEVAQRLQKLEVLETVANVSTAS